MLYEGTGENFSTNFTITVDGQDFLICFVTCLGINHSHISLKDFITLNKDLATKFIINFDQFLDHHGNSDNGSMMGFRLMPISSNSSETDLNNAAY